MNKKQIQRKPRRNHQIKISPIRLIDEKGENLGVVELTKALELSEDKGLDLIEIAPHARPPVCRIMDYGKYLYQQSKQEKKKKAHQKQTEIKGVRISFRISEHDMEIKAKQARKFLDKGNKVKIEMILKGREKGQMEKAKEKLKSFIEDISPEAKMEGEIKKSPRGLNTVIEKQQ